MITTALIAFREFLEAFLIVGIFLGISKKLQLKKEKEIIFAAAVGVLISLLMATLTYLFGDSASRILTEEHADFLESYLLIFSGLFIAYVVFSLHSVINRGRGQKLLTAHKKLQSETFDLSLFLTIVFMVVREGFEIALFTASVSLFSAFVQNFIGLVLGFALASVLGVLTFGAYIKFPIGKVFRVTEYMIILLGAALVQHGVTELFETHFGIHLSDMISFHLQFIPGEDTFIGHLIQGLTGIDNEFSLVRLMVMITYIAAVYFVFVHNRGMTSTQKKMEHA